MESKKTRDEELENINFTSSRTKISGRRRRWGRRRFGGGKEYDCDFFTINLPLQE